MRESKEKVGRGLKKGTPDGLRFRATEVLKDGGGTDGLEAVQGSQGEATNPTS